MRLAQALRAGIQLAARIGKRAYGGLAVLLLGLLVGGFVVHVQSRPWFDGWYNIYLDAKEADGCFAWRCRRGVPEPIEQFPTRPVPARRETYSDRRAVEVPRHVDSWSQYREREFAAYADGMAMAPGLCRRELRARLPEGWSAAPVLLGPSVRGPGHLTWRVSGRTTIVDETGARRDYRYQCDFVGDELREVVLTTAQGTGNPIPLAASR